MRERERREERKRGGRKRERKEEGGTRGRKERVEKEDEREVGR